MQGRPRTDSSYTRSFIRLCTAFILAAFLKAVLKFEGDYKNKNYVF